MPVLDPVVFDIGTFDAAYAVPVLFQVYVPREMQRIAVGQGVFFVITVVNVETSPHRRYPLSPDTVTVTVYDPMDRAIIGPTPMVSHGPGRYSYQLQMGLIGSDASVFDPGTFDTVHSVVQPGPYTGTFRAENGPRIMQTKKLRLFEVI